MDHSYTEQITDLLSKDDLIHLLVFTRRCLSCTNEQDFNNLLISFASFLEFDFVLYAYTKESYSDEDAVHLVNLSNPKEWATEYTDKGYLLHDPVRHEMERLINVGSKNSFILWDSYTWDLSPMQQQVIERRNHYGLYYGFSFFVDSKSKDFTLLFSFASSRASVTTKTKVLCELLGPHLLGACKRVAILELIAMLSEKEKVVAMWLMEGKTNSDIAEIIDITKHTVKFHIQNIFRKLHVVNRHQATAVLLAARYLGN